jgi:hypothetical protein
MACPNEPQPDEDGGATEADAARAIRLDVWSGNYDADEVLLMLREDHPEYEDIDDARLRAMIRHEFAAKRRAERTWPKVTDCDRLERVFEALEARGVIAEEDAGFTQSEGHYNVEELYKEAGGKKSKFEGYCFFTYQDQDAALDGPGLCLAFGHFSGNEKKGIEIGRVVREECERAGLRVDWDGTFRRRICLPDFCWQRRSP